MTRISDIMKVDEAEAKLIQEQSAILLQKKSEGFNGELKTSGYIVESYIKDFLKKHIPNGYRICSGYIATTDTINDSCNLIQHDVIIADNRIPSIYVFGISDIEVVPAEAVCGVFEIKRTLTKKSANEAISHLSKTREMLASYKGGIKSKIHALNNAAGPSLTVATTAPMYGILALDATNDLIKEELEPYIQDFIDIIWTLSQPLLLHFAIKDANETYYFPPNVSRNQQGYQNSYTSFWFREDLKTNIYAKAVSYFRVWTNNSSGRVIDSTDTQLYFGLK